MVTHITSAQSQAVGDEEGHVASLARFSGVAMFSDGIIATASFVAMTDYTNGAGAFTLFPILVFEDGSALHLRSVGTGTVDGTKTRFVGSATVLGGKGRFQGVKGGGMLTGTRYTPLSVGADLVSDYAINVER